MNKHPKRAKKWKKSDEQLFKQIQNPKIKIKNQNPKNQMCH
jgi:hypothetical protein